MRLCCRVICLAAAPATLAAPAAAQRTPAHPPAVVALETLPVAAPAARFRTGGVEALMGELRLPEGRGPFPVAVLVHGGCWREGFADERHLRPLAEALRADGIATWLVRYRRVDESGGGWPGTLADLAAAADSLRSLARRFSLDTARVIAVGHSSGASLGAWLATRSLLPERGVDAVALRGRAPLRVHGVVAIDGPLDLLAARPVIERVCGSQVLDSLMGGPPETQGARWRVGSPSRLLAITPSVRQAVVIGGLDASLARRQRPASLSAYAPSARAAVFVADTTSHFSMLDPSQPAFGATRDAVRHVLGLAPEGRKGADRAALLAAYRTFAAGMHARTMGPALALLAPGFEQRVPDGAGGMRTTPRERFVAGIERVATSLDTLRAFAIDVTDVTIEGDSATVRYREHFDAVFRPPAGGAAARDSSTSYWRDRWMRTPDGWRALRFERVEK